ncbi:ATP-binding protein [Myxococcus sp. SDU36]|uniref:ATP-binding protein n=1 Tax=Myxococcus sp. SDU36 TaxID=2831967 RepID=UPI0025427B42|nr:ATP-binding protein [Myxococcus sp. SDU36]
MSHDLVHARVREHLGRLRLGHLAERLDALLSEAARTEPTYLDFLDALLREEIGAKQKKRVSMGITIAHFPAVKTLEDFDFKAQPSVDSKLVRELATGRFIAQAENVLLFGPPGVGKTHLAIGLGRAAVEAGHSVLFTSATALLAALAKAESEGALKDKLNYFVSFRQTCVKGPGAPRYRPRPIGADRERHGGERQYSSGRVGGVARAGAAVAADA